MTNIQNIPFTEYWKTLTPSDKDETTIALSKKCNVALTTIQSWGLGYRVPRTRSQVLIAEYLVEKNIPFDFKTLFP